MLQRERQSREVYVLEYGTATGLEVGEVRALRGGAGACVVPRQVGLLGGGRVVIVPVRLGLFLSQAEYHVGQVDMRVAYMRRQAIHARALLGLRVRPAVLIRYGFPLGMRLRTVRG